MSDQLTKRLKEQDLSIELTEAAKEKSPMKAWISNTERALSEEQSKTRGRPAVRRAPKRPYSKRPAYCFGCRRRRICRKTEAKTN